MKLRHLRHALLLLPLLLLAAPLRAQVMVAPTAVFVDERDPFGSYVVLNQSPVEQEVTVDFRFGMPVSDSAGETRMVYGDSLSTRDRSANEWVRAFPRQFTLAPGAQQTVRLALRPPQGLGNGVYWTRVITTSTPVSAPVDTVATGVAARVVFRLEQITTLLYRRGQLSLAMGAVEPRVTMNDSAVSVLVPLDLQGNAPFFGEVSVRVLDESGAQAGEEVETFAMYVDMVKRFDFARSTLKPGRYTAEVRVAAERSDIPPADLIPMTPVTGRVSFTVQ